MSVVPNVNTRYFTKDPDDDLDYGAEWSTWLDTGDTIATSTWIIPTGLGSHSQAHTTTQAVTWLTGGALGARYEVVNRIVTTQGRTADQTLIFTIRQK